MAPHSLTAEADQACRLLCEQQHGLLAGYQAASKGLSTYALHRRVHSGELELLMPGVYRHAGAPHTWTQRATAAGLWIAERGALTGRSSLKLQGIETLGASRIEVATPNRLRSPVPWIVVRNVKRLDPCDILIRKGVPVTVVEVALMDLGTRIHIDLIEEAMDECLRCGHTTIPRLTKTLFRLAKRGRTGCAATRTLIEIRDPSVAVPESVLERRLLRLFERYGLPIPETQYWIEDGDFRARVDFAYPDVKLAIEADSRRHHAGHVDWERDRERSSRIAAAGWRMLNITWLKVRTRPLEIVALVRKALEFFA